MRVRRLSRALADASRAIHGPAKGVLVFFCFHYGRSRGRHLAQTCKLSPGLAGKQLIDPGSCGTLTMSAQRSKRICRCRASRLGALAWRETCRRRPTCTRSTPREHFALAARFTAALHTLDGSDALKSATAHAFTLAGGDAGRLFRDRDADSPATTTQRGVPRTRR